METNVLEALILIFAAAVMNATYTLPMKLNRKWRWEHSWCAFSLLGVAVVPTIISIATVPQLWSIYPSVSAGTLLAMALFGVGWGVSLVFFGLSLPLVGVAVTFTVTLSTSAASGALLPLVTQHPERLFTTQGLVLLSGILLIVFGVTFCGRAGLERERLAGNQEERKKNGFVRGFLYSIISGVLGSLLNLGLAYGGAIQQLARDRGASNVMLSNAIWLPCVYAGFIPGVIYCVYLMRKNSALSEFLRNAKWHYWLMGASMGLLWYGSVLLYSFSAMRLGDIGTAIGWPLFLSSIVVMSTVVGLFTGEWKLTLNGPFRTLLVGLFFLLFAIAVLSEASRMTA